jgi:hypothetical protein
MKLGYLIHSDTSKNKAFIRAVANREAKGLSKDNTVIAVGRNCYSVKAVLPRNFTELAWRG